MMERTATVLKAMGERVWPLTSAGDLCLGKAPHKPISATIVEGMLSSGVITTADGGVRRTAEGRALVRRALATAGERGEAQPFATQHRALATAGIKAGDEIRTVTKNMAESPLSWLASRKDKTGAPYIDATQCAAGERLQRDFNRGHQSARVTQSWDASGVHGSRPTEGMLISESAHDARLRVERAMEAVGPDLADALYGVCCEELGLEAVEKRCGWPLRSGKVVLRIALDRLAEHYGMATVACGRETRRIVRWGTADYRPHA